MEAAANELMKMKQLSQVAGLPVSTIKFYMAKGLLPHPLKEKRNVAYYDRDFLDRLLVIKRMRSDGVSVNGIREIFARHSFRGISDWEDFRRQAREKGSRELGQAERMAAMTAEERRAQQIREAAFRVFSLKGYHNTTMEDIACEAGVSKGTCYQYFGGKEDVFIATIEASLREVMEEGEKAAAGVRGSMEKIAARGAAFISRYQSLHFMIMGVIAEALGGNERLKAKGSEFFRTVADFLAADIRSGIEQGIFRPVDPLRVAYALIGIAEVAGDLSVVEPDFDLVDFFRGLGDFMQSGLTQARIPE